MSGDMTASNPKAASAALSAKPILGAFLALGIGTLFVLSLGRLAPLRDDAGQIIPGSLSERVTIHLPETRTRPQRLPR